ncbi:hypothetical protein [Rubinisphaera sp.]|uniref:hypothetical protein n=1 Tax=Rubinisphaera sp. TaxID=2024857 RepID=UPI000C0E3FB6|nr:hypothetical protein [Rubinisphaera sp.]MBV09021.1 hypothetical protein [Rubinisphaera sp.]HCS53247.1 hypothetical protein [Planctomycetaceae bacterium]|tara:strand:- start:888 stop:1487 length:600 start_codon:yes stop_codon:yes gene_type:complete
MSYRLLTLSAITVLLLIFTSDAVAQPLTVQQPVVSQFSVNSTVSVPDRGSTHLGSLSTARDSRFHSRTWPRGSSTSRSLTHQSVSVSAHIHNFEEMDELLLQQGKQSLPLPLESELPSNLHFRSFRQTADVNPVHRKVRSSAPITNSQTTTYSSSLAEIYYEKAVQAIADDNPRLAKIYFQLAADRGSAPAQTQLNNLR